MQKIRYDEAKEWFWIRTWVWSVPAAIVTAMACFLFSADMVSAAGPRAWLSVAVGVVAVLLGILSALVSLQLPWMRRGWLFGFVLNGPSCALAAALLAFLIGGVAMSFVQDQAIHEYPALPDLSSVYRMLWFGIGVSALWGFIIGSWFAMRRDKYFIEQL